MRFNEKTCSLIDNILVNPPAKSGILDSKKITSHVFLKRLGKTDHQPCLLAIDIKLIKCHPPKFIKFRKAMPNAEDKMKNDLQDSNLLNQLNPSPYGCPNESYNTILTTVQTAYDKNYPEITARFQRHKHKIQPWMTDNILHLIKAKDKFYVRYRKAKPNSATKFLLKHHMESINQRINQSIIEAKNKYYQEEIEKK